MKYLTRVLTILSLLVVLAGGALVTEAAPSPHIGSWTTVDVDGSTIQLLIVGGRLGVFQLKWEDDYWSICDGAPGSGSGTGTVDIRNSNILHTKLTFYCDGMLWNTLKMSFTYDPITDTMVNDTPPSLTWSRR